MAIGRMTDQRADATDSQRVVIVVDARTLRRQQLARRPGGHRVVEAASLSEVFPLAEEMEPDVLAISADFLIEPEFEGVIRLAEMLGSRLFLYAADGRAPVRSPLRHRVVCVPLETGDSIDDLLSRLANPRSHLSADAGRIVLPELILIGASTGGIAAIEAVLTTFPTDCPPTLVVQHIRDGYVPGLVQRLNNRCRPRIVAATDGLPLRRGTIHFAADAERHLVVAGKAAPRCALVPLPPCHGHRPAVDPLFESAVPWGPQVSAALLTGMGTDGALGLGALRRAGAHTIAQDRATSTIWGMPRAAVESGAAVSVLPLDRIGASLLTGHSQSVSELSMGRAR